MSQSTTRAPRKPVRRALKILSAIAADGTGAIRITAGRVTADYHVQTFKAFDSCTGVSLRKSDGTMYDVCIAPTPSETSCDCLGHTQHRHCKHVEALLVLQRMGQLPLPLTPVYRESFFVGRAG